MLTRRRVLGRLAGAGLGAGLGIPACATPVGHGQPLRLRYGSHPAQFGELYLPAAGSGQAFPQPEPQSGSGPTPAPTGPARGAVVVVHGGFWRQSYGLELGRPLAADLAALGVPAWNIEYRRVGADGGGWPATFVDVAAALDALADVVPAAAPGWIDLDRAVAVGHSAGGHLAVWLAARPGLPAGAPGSVPRVRLRGVVSQSGVLDLVDAAEQGVGGTAVPDLIGDRPDRVPDRYELASPIARVPLHVPVVCVHGTADDIVPIRQSERYVEAATAAGDPAELIRLPNEDHFAVINPRSAAWTACRDAALRLLG